MSTTSSILIQLSEQCSKIAEGLASHAPQGTPTGSINYMHDASKILAESAIQAKEAEKQFHSSHGISRP